MSNFVYPPAGRMAPARELMPQSIGDPTLSHTNVGLHHERFYSYYGTGGVRRSTNVYGESKGHSQRHPSPRTHPNERINAVLARVARAQSEQAESQRRAHKAQPI